jgi:dolichol-phosphate mannosyltransferase
MGFLAEKLRDLQTMAPDDMRMQFVIVDDGSSDNTWEQMHQHFELQSDYRLLRHEKNRGIMAALMTGFAVAETEWVASLDADCTFDPVCLLELLAQATPSIDVVVGSPYHPKGKVENVPAWRLVLSKGASWLYQRLMRSKLYCYTSCFRVYRVSTLRTVNVEAGGFVGMAELLWKLDRAKARMVEVPAVLNVRRYGQSKMRTLSVIGDHLKLMARIMVGR